MRFENFLTTLNLCKMLVLQEFKNSKSYYSIKLINDYLEFFLSQEKRLCVGWVGVATGSGFISTCLLKREILIKDNYSIVQSVRARVGHLVVLVRRDDPCLKPVPVNCSLFNLLVYLFFMVGKREWVRSSFDKRKVILVRMLQLHTINFLFYKLSYSFRV